MALVSASPNRFENALAALYAARLLPVVTLPDAQSAIPVGQALLAGGLPLIEITCRTPAAIPAIRKLRQECPQLLVGAGTVLSATLAQEALDAGAQCLVAPNFDETVLSAAESRGVPMLPGVLTPTEVGRARSRGLGIVKVFPASDAGGPSYLRTLASVFPEMKFVPTGGVGPAELRDYLSSAAVAACGGSWLTPSELLRERRFEEIQALVAEAVSSVRQAGAPRK